MRERERETERERERERESERQTDRDSVKWEWTDLLAELEAGHLLHVVENQLQQRLQGLHVCWARLPFAGH